MQPKATIRFHYLPILKVTKSAGWNKVLRQSTGNYIQYPITNHNGKEYIHALRNRDTDVENKHMDTKGGKGGDGGGMNWEIGIDIYTLICIKQIRTCCVKNK